jgi:hypothetical protein
VSVSYTATYSIPRFPSFATVATLVSNITAGDAEVLSEIFTWVFTPANASAFLDVFSFSIAPKPTASRRRLLQSSSTACNTTLGMQWVAEDQITKWNTVIGIDNSSLYSMNATRVAHASSGTPLYRFASICKPTTTPTTTPVPVLLDVKTFSVQDGGSVAVVNTNSVVERLNSDSCTLKCRIAQNQLQPGTIATLEEIPQSTEFPPEFGQTLLGSTTLLKVSIGSVQDIENSRCFYNCTALPLINGSRRLLALGDPFNTAENTCQVLNPKYLNI